jgi:hypothetical protein
VVILYDSFGGRITVLSALDGSVVKEWNPGFQEEQLIAVWEATGLIESAGDQQYRLDAVSLRHDEIVWTRELTADSTAFPAGPDWQGVLHPDGQVEVLRRSDGGTAGTLSVDVPQPLVHIRCLHDAERLYLILSGSRNDPSLEAATPGGGIQSNEGHRRLIVNGECYALDRNNLKLQWRSPISNASVALDQPVDVPLLICNELRYPPDRIGQGAMVGRVRVIDRRTGELLYDDETAAVHNYFLIERNAEAGWVELRLPGRVIRFDFAEKSPGAEHTP